MTNRIRTPQSIMRRCVRPPLTLVIIYVGVWCALADSFGDTTARAYAQASGCATPSFAATTFDVSIGPRSVTTGDFNADGALDLATVNQEFTEGSNVSVLLGNGAGGFAPAMTFESAGSLSLSVTSADFNADGSLDLATANYGTDNVSILLGNGTGSFSAATTHGVSEGPYFVIAADFNGDARPDLATANSDSDSISVLLGNGAGGFAAAQTFASPSGPASVTAGDFNGDNKPDLAAANYRTGSVSILLGNGAGGFAMAANVRAGDALGAITTGDFNGDNKPDLATTAEYSTNVWILLGDGAGGFATPTTVSASVGADSIAVGDFNADGNVDLATASSGFDKVSILLGDGAGSFAAEQTFGTGDYPLSITTGDFNTDHKLDLVTANDFAGSVSVLLNDCMPNTAPTAVDDSYLTSEDSPLTIGAGGLLANDGDLDGDALTAARISGPSHGTLSLSADGGFTYTPSASFTGTDSFTYQASDGQLVSNPATVIIQVRYRFSGFFQPVDNLPIVNRVNAGQAIPLKFSLTGYQGLSIFGASVPSSQPSGCSGTAPVDDIETTTAASAAGLQYEAGSDTYTYVWKTDKSWKSTCRQLTVRLDDGSTRILLFQFK